jgi:NAD-dependent SIR2 family protein deacetylase
MGISKITVTLYTCERCEHEWIPREAIAGTEALPTVCPKCKSPYWKPATSERGARTEAGAQETSQEKG